MSRSVANTPVSAEESGLRLHDAWMPPLHHDPVAHLRLVQHELLAFPSKMMLVTNDGKRMYVSNSLLSTLDHSGRFYVRLCTWAPTA
jgi:hypothetical protein